MSTAVESDEAARILAQREYVHPVSLQAGAGTGKTAVLVARVCVWSLGEGWERAAQRLADRAGESPPERLASETFRRVVAITFTEAAAAEMAVRVGAALLKLQAGERTANPRVANLAYRCAKTAPVLILHLAPFDSKPVTCTSHFDALLRTWQGRQELSTKQPSSQILKLGNEVALDQIGRSALIGGNPSIATIRRLCSEGNLDGALRKVESNARSPSS